MRSFLLVQFFKEEVLKLIIAVKYVVIQVILYDIISLTAILVRLFGIYVLTRSSLSKKASEMKQKCGIIYSNGCNLKNWSRLGCMWCGCYGTTRITASTGFHA